MANYPKGYKEVPWGITTLWGARKVGKTIAALNSPWQPVHVIDVEFSAKDYETNMEQMAELGIIPKPFTRTSCLDQDAFFTEFARIAGNRMKGITTDVRYGTIILDTVGQVTQWIADYEFKENESIAEKQSQVVWGKVRARIRSMVLDLTAHCSLLVLCAHEREFRKIFSPRCNPAVLELSSLSIRLVRPPNQKVPDGVIDIARLPVFPPRIPEFTIASLLKYIKKPADWDNLNEDEKVSHESPILPDEQDSD